MIAHFYKKVIKWFNFLIIMKNKSLKKLMLILKYDIINISIQVILELDAKEKRK